MQKDFDEWNKIKKSAHARTDIDSVFFREQEIWWCMLGANIGFEQKRFCENQKSGQRTFSLNAFLICPPRQKPG
jgi:hypothetical protein